MIYNNKDLEFIKLKNNMTNIIINQNFNEIIGKF